MKTILALLLMTSTCFGQAIASRRYALDNPTQMAFGSFSAVAPYNEANGYTAIPFGQMQPANGIISSNNFSSTSNFTVYADSGNTAGTFSVSGNVGTVAWTGGSQSGTELTDTSTSYNIPYPGIFVSVEVVKGPSVTSTNYGGDRVGIALDGSNWLELSLCVTVGCSSNNATITAMVSGTQTNVCGVHLTQPSSPYWLGIGVEGQYASAYYSTNGTSWTYLTECSVGSYYNFNTASLSGWKATASVFLGANDTVQLANLTSGLIGGVGVRDIQLVTYPDGRPFVQGTAVYLDCTIASPAGASTGGYSQSGIFSYDTSSGLLTYLGSLWYEYSAGVYGASASQIIYDPANNEERLVASTWGLSLTPSFVAYSTQSISTDDWLAIGPHLAPTATQITSPYGLAEMYDPSMACTQWNYSTGTCAKWLLAMESGNHTGVTMQFSTSDPSSNTWTGIINDTTGGAAYEGSRVLRTATTYSGQGATYTTCFGGVIGSSTRSSRCYNEAGTFTAPLNVTWPAGSSNPSHPQVFCLGNTAYLITFNDNLFKSITQTMGNFLVATASGCGE